MAEVSLKMPLLPLRGMVVFPYMIIHLDVGRPRSIAALEEAMAKDRQIFLTAQIDAEVDEPHVDDIYTVGTIAEVKQILKLPGGTIRVLVEGMRRGKLTGLEEQEKIDVAWVEEYPDVTESSMEMEAFTHTVVDKFEEWVKISKKLPAELLVSVAIIEDTGRLADLIASHLNLKLEVRQELLELSNVKARLERLFAILLRELEVQAIERRISARVRKQMEKIQKDYYLREQIKAIHKELGDGDKESEIDECRKQLEEGDYPENVKKCVEKELARMESMPGSSAEVGVIRTYVDCLLELPWNKMSEDSLNLKKAAKVLDQDHYGLEKVKERIIEFLAVQTLLKANESPSKAPILCLVGPPGVGKTSLAASVARAVGRKLARASLGGIRDEAEIRGHRRTYVGAMPGRIMAGIRTVGVKNPVFLLDEVDKMNMDFKGDPSAALLEVLDPAQNASFSDNYVGLPFDLSHVLWIVTANNLGNIPRALRDRMEIIQISSYTEQEKLEIAKKYLIARQRKENGLETDDIRFAPDALRRIIAEYTREAGVRELERLIGTVCRKVAKAVVDEAVATVKVGSKDLEKYLGRPKYMHTKAEKEPQIGVCTGMAWTEVGGDILPTEVTVLKGKGKLLLTGQLGDVMQESAQAGLSYIRSRAEKFNLPADFHEKYDIHIHLPEGAIPKDGPSAGITMATAMLSALIHRKVRSDVAMTGEITLRGRVLAIGGLKEKVLAAFREGMKTIILPKDNERDIEDIPEAVREKLEFVPVQNMDEVLDIIWEK